MTNVFKPKWDISLKLKRENYELRKEVEMLRKGACKKRLEELRTVKISYDDIDYLVQKGAMRDDIATALKVGVPVRELLILKEDIDEYFTDE